MSSTLLLALSLVPQSPSSDVKLERPVDAATIVQVDHISLHVADIERSARFYHDVLGLTELDSPVPGLRWFSVGRGVQLHLLPKRQTVVADVRSNHLAFAVADLDRFITRLRSANISWWDFAGEERAVSHRRDGVRQIYMTDPDGYWIEINDH